MVFSKVKKNRTHSRASARVKQLQEKMLEIAPGGLSRPLPHSQASLFINEELWPALFSREGGATRQGRHSVIWGEISVREAVLQSDLGAAVQRMIRGTLCVCVSK